jgi:hypothetical protein
VHVAAEGIRSVHVAAEGKRSVHVAAEGKRSVHVAAEGKRSVHVAAEGILPCMLRLKAVSPCMLRLKKLQCRLNPRSRSSFSYSQSYPHSTFIYSIYPPLEYRCVYQSVSSFAHFCKRAVSGCAVTVVQSDAV